MNTNLYYLWKEAQLQGPFTLDQLRNMWSSGGITVNDLYCLEGLDQWLPLGEIQELLETTPKERSYSVPSISVQAPAPKPENVIAMLFKLAGCIFIILTWWSCDHRIERQKDEKFWGDHSGSKASTVFSSASSFSEKVDAFTTAELYVQGQLKSPSTAKFCSCSEADISHYDGKTVVTGYVDAENSFGARPRSYWTCALTGEPGRYRVSTFAWK